MSEDTYMVERSTLIAAEPQRIYEQIIAFRKWRAWSPWEDLDPELERQYSGPEAGIGSTYRWSGNRKAGQGQMRINDVSERSRVDIELNFEKPWKAQNRIVFSLDSEGAGTRVMWTMIGKKTLTTRVMGIFKSMDSLVGPDFEKGLARLKATVESSVA